MYDFKCHINFLKIGFFLTKFSCYKAYYVWDISRSLAEYSTSQRQK
jgi:hypothetical protein